MEYLNVIKLLRKHADPKNVAGMARFGINPHRTLGVSIPILRKMTRQIGRNQSLAQKLWDSKIHEARLLAGFIGEPKLLTSRQMDRWVKDFDSWDICDQVCSNLFDRTPFAYKKAFQWSKDKREFVKRAGFVMMAALSVHDKKAPDSSFIEFLPVIKREARDERNFAKKAVNWALRQIGKRNPRLRKKAILTARAIIKIDAKSARWIASDALRELIK